MKKALFTIALLYLFFILHAPAQFTNATVSGSNIILKGMNGSTNPDFELLTSTNLSLPPTNWTTASTNNFPSNGHFVLTNPLSSKASQQFFAIQTLPALNSIWVPTCGAFLGAVVTNDTAQNFTNVELQIGRQNDLMRIYHTPGSWTSLTSEEKMYLNAGRMLLESVKPNSKWSNAVGVANGGSATVDSQMASLAQSIASVKPHKLMLIVWHEPENDVVPGGSAGTTTQYVQMWQNVQNIFNANGATNVIWVWDVENLAPAQCSCSASYRALLPSLWPGNTNIDWVMWDPYSADESITDDVANSYNWFITNSTSVNNWASKPFGLAEWGVGINSYYPTVAQQTNGMNQMNYALNVKNMFPKLKLVEYYNDLASAILPGAWGAYSNFANSAYMTQQCSP